MAERKTIRERFSTLFIANIKALWESGRFSSIEDFKKYGDENFKKFPSLSFLKIHSGKEGWNKNRTAEELKKRVESSFSDMFEAKGCGDPAIVEAVCLGIQAPERVIQKMTAYALSSGGTIDDETLKKFQSLLKNSLDTALDYIEERNKLCGSYPATKHKHSGKVFIGDLTNMSQEEAAAEHERIHQNFVAAGLSTKP